MARRCSASSVTNHRSICHRICRDGRRAPPVNALAIEARHPARSRRTRIRRRDRFIRPHGSCDCAQDDGPPLVKQCSLSSVTIRSAGAAMRSSRQGGRRVGRPAAGIVGPRSGCVKTFAIPSGQLQTWRRAVQVRQALTVRSATPDCQPPAFRRSAALPIKVMERFTLYASTDRLSSALAPPRPRMSSRALPRI